jgi:hypothetical protein
MPLRFDCPTCGAELQISRLHRGRQVLCRACAASESVPQNVDFGAIARDSLADRRSGYRLLYWGLAAAFLQVLPLSAWLWFGSQSLVDRTRAQDRPLPEPVRAARVVAIVATGSQMLLWGRLVAGL